MEVNLTVACKFCTRWLQLYNKNHVQAQCDMLKMVLFQTPVVYSLQIHNDLSKIPFKIPHVITENISVVFNYSDRTVVDSSLKVFLNRLQLNVCFEDIILTFHTTEDKCSMN